MRSIVARRAYCVCFTNFVEKCSKFVTKSPTYGFDWFDGRNAGKFLTTNPTQHSKIIYFSNRYSWSPNPKPTPKSDLIRNVSIISLLRTGSFWVHLIQLRRIPVETHTIASSHALGSSSWSL